MDKTEIENLIDQKVDTAVSRQFGMIMEWFTDQFGFVHEKFEMLEEKMNARFDKVEADMEQIKRNTDTHSLEILALQDKDRESWRKTARLEEEYKLLDKRVERLETNYNYV